MKALNVMTLRSSAFEIDFQKNFHVLIQTDQKMVTIVRHQGDRKCCPLYSVIKIYADEKDERIYAEGDWTVSLLYPGLCVAIYTHEIECDDCGYTTIYYWETFRSENFEKQKESDSGYNVKYFSFEEISEILGNKSMIVYREDF